MLALELGVVAFLIVLNGFFAMAELAVVSSRSPYHRETVRHQQLY